MGALFLWKGLHVKRRRSWVLISDIESCQVLRCESVGCGAKRACGLRCDCPGGCRGQGGLGLRALLTRSFWDTWRRVQGYGGLLTAT